MTELIIKIIHKMENFNLPPRMTFGSERFIALHMMYERMAPELPIRAPTIVIKLLLSMKPSAHKAHPEYEFKTVITTGMSAPPIAAVKVTPMTVDIAAVAPSHERPPRSVGSMKNAPIAKAFPASKPPLM